MKNTINYQINKYWLIIPASGIGARIKSNIPKQYIKLTSGKTILDTTLEKFINIKKIAGFIVAIDKKDNFFSESKYINHKKLLTTVYGDNKRFISVLNAVRALDKWANDNDWVLVHDACRPCISERLVLNLINNLKNEKVGGLLATPVVDTIKKAGDFDYVAKTVDRNNLYQAQTPQMYRFWIIKKALEEVINNKLTITDETQAVEHLGLKAKIVKSDTRNIKITHPEDIDLANFYLMKK